MTVVMEMRTGGGAIDASVLAALQWPGIIGDLDWMSEANCREVDPETFCLDSGIDESTLALMMCRVCPVLTQCHERTAHLVARAEPPTGLVQGGVAHRMHPTKDLGVEEWLVKRAASVERIQRMRLVVEKMHDHELDELSGSLAMESVVRVERFYRLTGTRLLPEIPDSVRKENERTVEISLRRARARAQRAKKEAEKDAKAAKRST